MATVRILLDKYVAEEIQRLTQVLGQLIEAPYEFKTLSNISNFSVVFNTKDNDWTLESLDKVAVVLAKRKPENWSSSTNIVVCLCDNPRDVYAYLMGLSLNSLRGTWTRHDQLSYVHPSAKIHRSTQVDTNVYIDEGVEIGANCSVGFQGFGFGRLNNVGYQLIHIGGAI